MKCPRCQHENPTGMKFCGQCAAPLASTCPSCGATNPPEGKFCGQCAAALQTTPTTKFASPVSYTPKHLAEKILTSKAALEGERKQVTVLFCDLVNSTSLAERLGEEAMHALLNRFFELALAEVHRYEGTINQFLGDGFMALFGAPLAHEDHARRAVLASLGIHRALKEHHGTLGRDVAVRMGLNTGPVVVGKIGDNLRMDYTAVGDTTNLAARLQQSAEAGAIYLSESTHRLAQAYIESIDLGARPVKGKPDPVVMYRVLGTRSRAELSAEHGPQAIGSPLVGRAAEMAAVLGCVARLVTGEGGIVGVVGEAGLGKSRLIAEVRRSARDRDLLWLEGRALSFGRTLSYWPFLEILRQWAGITDDADDGESWARLRDQVARVFPEHLGEILPYLATLLGITVPPDFEDRVKYLDAQAVGRQIFRAGRRLFERLAKQRPLVVVLEDLHWADQSSVELLEHLFPLVESAPILFVGIGRPDRDSPATQLRKLARTSYAARYTEVVFAPLSPSASAALVDNLLASPDLPPAFRELILHRTEGNPFFMEEVVRSLIGQGTLVRDQPAGRWRITAPVERVTIPDTVHGVIMARVDRLAEDIKHLLKLASVIGRTFLYQLLNALTDAGRALDGQLGELQELELIREKQRAPELEYIFKHALVQEATYESILVERRRQLHRHVAASIERLFVDRLDEMYGVLAYHYARAEDLVAAQQYLVKAGDQAGRIAADAEALAHYRKAMKVYEQALGDRWEPAQQATLEQKMGEALLRRGQHDEAIEHLHRALAALGHPYPTSRRAVRVQIIAQIMRQVGHRFLPRLALRRSPASDKDSPELRSRLYEMLGRIDYFWDQERMLLDALIHVNSSERGAYSLGMVKGCAILGLVCDLLPISRVAAAYHRRAVALAEESQHPLALGWAYMGLGFHDHYTGHLSEALQHYRSSAHAFYAVGDMQLWGYPTVLITHVQRFTGDFRAGLEPSRELLRVGQDSGDRQLHAWGLHATGRVLRLTGAVDAAIPHFEKAIELYRLNPDYIGAVHASGDLACCLLRQGRVEEALVLLEQASRDIVQRRMRGHQVTEPRNALAEAYLVAAEGAAGVERAALRHKAEEACRTTVRHGRTVREGVPGAYRLTGRYHWLSGNPAGARRWWERSLTAAEQLGARYELGLTLLEMGRRLGGRPYVERAGSIFADLGASFESADARNLLLQGTARRSSE